MKNSILGKARWLREVALATSKNNGARVAREWLKYAAMFVMLFTIGVGDAWADYTLIKSNTSLSNGDKVIIVMSSTTPTNGSSTGVTGSNGSKDATVSTSESGWVQYTVGSASASGWTLYDETEKKYIASPGTTNQFIYGNSGGICSVNSNGVLTCNKRYLCKNSSNYRMYSSIGTYSPFYVWKVSSTPTLTMSSSMTTLTYSNGSPVAQSFTIGGSNLTNTVTVTAPTDYEVCKTSGGTYTSSVSFTNTEVNAADKTVYIRLQSGLSAGDITSRDITIASSGATSKTIAITGSVPYTITWMANGSTFETTYVAVGSTLALPASDPEPGTYSCAGKYFYGWYGDGSSYSSASLAPSIAAAGASVSADKTYYAVFAERSGSGAVTWDKVTSAPSDWSGDYVIVYSGGAKAMISEFYSGTSGEFKSADVTINAAGTQITSTPTDKMIWTVAKNGDNAQYSFKNKSTNTYANITGTSSTNAALSASAIWFTIESTGTNGVWDVASVTNSARCFAWYNTRSTFRTYAKSSNNTGCLFKKSGEGYTYSNYETSCCTPLGQINGSINVNNATSVTLQWGAVEGAEKYQVKVPGSSSHDNWTDVNSTSVTVTKSCGTEYTAYFRAIDTNGSHCAEGPESTLDIPAVSWTVSPTISYGTASPAIPSTTCNGFNTTISPESGYALPAGVTVTNADKTWNSSTGELTISNVTGNVTITVTCAAESCSGQYTFDYGGTKQCFSQVGETNEFQITGYTIPTTTTGYWVGYNGYFYNSNLGTNGAKSANNQFKYMPVANLQGSGCSASGENYYHAMKGAYGTLRIYQNSNADNLYIGFVPAGYQMRVGSGDSWSNIQLTQEGSSAVWKSAIMEMDAVTIAKNYYVNIYTGSSYNSSDEGVAINNWTNGGSTISSMQRKTNSGKEDWASGVTAGMRGFFRTWTDNCANNGYCHFVPMHRIVYHANWPAGESPADTYSVDVSVEETNNSIELASAPSAPTGYHFVGWYNAASGGDEATGTQTISAGTSADVELYAHWAANTINLTLDKNNSDDSGSSNGSGTIMFDGNTTATITGATRTGHTVEGYYSDAACTADNKVLDANGNVINSTVSGYTTSGKWTRATTPTTLYTKWTPNNYTITWSVNNQTWTKGVTEANNHANHGATVNAPAGDGNVPTGAAMPCGTYTFMGWSADITPTSADGGNAPADLFTTTSPAITKETTFYAVFAEGGKGYTRATQVSDITVGSHIIIGYEADHSEAQGTVVPARSGDYNGTSYMRSGTTSGSSNNNTIDLTSSVANESDYIFTVEAGHNTGYFALKGSDNKYIGHNGKNAAKAYDAIDTDGKTDYSFAFGENDVVTITNKWGNENTTTDGSNSYNFQWLRYNSTNYRFAIYRTGQNDPVIYIVNSASNYKTYCDDTKAYVNYNAAGGTTSCTREAVTKGTNYTVCSSTPTKTGYTFQGWLSNETTPQTYQPNATISNVQNDIVLTAQWTATTYTITYNGVKPGAENTNPTSYTVEDLPINLVAATHDQWRFDGWTDDNAGNADITTIPAGTTGNQSFTAHWTQRYAVTWYEESTPTVTYFDPGATLTFPADPSAPASCSEKKFVGWMVGTITGETDDKPTFITAGEVNADAAYHAVWANSAGSAIAAVEDNTFTQSDVSKATYCGVGNGLQSVGKYVQNQSIWNASQMTGVHVKIKVYHVSNDRADVLRISLINSSGEEVVGTDLTTSKLGNSSSSAGYSSNVTLTPTTAVTGYKVSLKTKNSSGTSVGKVTREVVPAYSKYSTSCCDNNVAAPSVTATATRNSITLSWENVTDATGYKVTINGGTHEVTTAACTYTESGLTSGTDYAWTVVATYNPANYCGAIPTKNTTTTLSVYGVTYNKNTTIGSGTVTMSPMPSDASTYVVGENVTAAAKPATCTNSGYTFNGWNTEPDGTGTHVDAGGTIAMVEGGLTLYAEWVAKRAYYVDRMHGQGDQTIEIGGKTYHCYYGDGYHITPSPSDQKSGDACQAPHYRFVRWLTIGHINADGTQKDTGGAVSGGVQRGTVTDGETYYAIWEEEIE